MEETSKLPTAVELKALTDRLKSASATMMQKLSNDKHQAGVTDLKTLILALAKKNCPERYNEICLQYAEALPYQKPVQTAAQEQISAERIVCEVANSFMAKFGYFDFKELPVFQQETMKAMAMLHLGYKPKEKTDLNPLKGVYLCGKSQIGKSTIFKHLKDSGHFFFRNPVSYSLSLQASEDPASVIASYSEGQYLLIDEVGMELPARHFGAIHDVVPEIIHARYEKGLHTHFTSNYDVDDLRYDHHIKMRIKQGCNIIISGAEPFMK